MFGFLIGTLSLIGLIKVLTGGCGHGRWGGHGGWHGGVGRSWMLRGLFRRLDTTPGQEKVILESLEAVQGACAKFRDEAEKLRADAARAFSGEKLDHEPLKAAFLRQDGLIEELRREVLVALEKIHEALDERQRKLAGEMLERGFWHAGGWGHGCCSGGWRRRGCGEAEDVRYTTQTV